MKFQHGICVTVREFSNTELFRVQSGADMMGGGTEERKKFRNMGNGCVAVLNRVFKVSNKILQGRKHKSWE